MNDSFERIIRDKLEHHTVPVNPNDWHVIVKQMQKKRPHKLVRFAGAAIAAAASVLLIVVMNVYKDSSHNIQYADVPEQVQPEPRHADTPSNDNTDKTLTDKESKTADSQIEVDKTDKTLTDNESKTADSQIEVGKPDKSHKATSRPSLDSKANQESLALNSNTEIESDNNRATDENKPSSVAEQAVSSTTNNTVAATVEDNSKDKSVTPYIDNNFDKPASEQNNRKNLKSKINNRWLLASNFSTNSSGSKSIADNGIIPLKSAGNGLKNYNNAKYAPPMSFGLTIRKNFGKHFGIETGLSYTYLYAKFENVSASDEKWTSHYLGIPVNAVVYLWNKPEWDIYLSVGGMAEKGLGEKYEEIMLTNGNSTVTKYSIDGVQLSLNGAAGVTYKFAEKFGIYLEPKVGYYFNGGQAKHSIRKDRPLTIGINAGLRYTF